MRKGFSLIELVVVMGIVGTLIGIGVSSYISSASKSRDARRKADLKIIQAALEQYKTMTGEYPMTDWVNSKTSGSPWIAELTGEYIKTMPVDPTNNLETPPGDPSKPGNYIYGYYSADNVEGACPGLKGGEYYVLATRLENLSDPDASQTMLTNTCKWPAVAAAGIYALSNP